MPKFAENNPQWYNWLAFAEEDADLQSQIDDINAGVVSGPTFSGTSQADTATTSGTLRSIVTMTGASQADTALSDGVLDALTVTVFSYLLENGADKYLAENGTDILSLESVDVRTLSGASQADTATASGAVEVEVAASGTSQADTATSAGQLGVDVFLAEGASQAETATSAGTLKSVASMTGEVQADTATSLGELTESPLVWEMTEAGSTLLGAASFVDDELVAGGGVDGAYWDFDAAEADDDFSILIFATVDSIADFARLLAIPLWEEGWAGNPPFAHAFVDHRTGGIVRLGVEDVGGDLDLADSPSSFLYTGSEIRLGIVRDDTSVKFFKNGSLIATVSFSDSVEGADLTPIVNEVIVLFNRHSTDSADGVDGTAHLAEFYSIAFSDTEMEDLTFLAGAEVTLVSRYRLDDGSAVDDA